MHDSDAVYRRIHGHLWTFGPHVVQLLRPEGFPRDEPFEALAPDERFGEVRLTGWLRAPRGRRRLVVLLHGMGGSADSRYIARTAREVDRAGLGYLRLNLRGADRSGEDFYHAGLSSDLHAVLQSPALAHFESIWVIGFSLGGHVVLRWASDSRPRDPRVHAVAVVCAPVDLASGAAYVQRPFGRPYQRHVLSGLKEMYRAVAARRPVNVPVDDAMRIADILTWDEAIVAPRWGFHGREDYYARASAGPRLAHLGLPTLFVAAEADPMVSMAHLEPWLKGASSQLEVAFSARGGHVAFPEDLDLGIGVGAGPLEHQLLAWLLRREPGADSRQLDVG